MPRKVNLDQASIDAGTIFTIGGQDWFAPEPTHELLKEVLSIEDGKTSDRSAQETIEVAYEQAAMLLRGWDEENQAPTDEKPSPDWLHGHLTPRRASEVIQTVLGEGVGTAPTGTGTVPPS